MFGEIKMFIKCPGAVACVRMLRESTELSCVSCALQTAAATTAVGCFEVSRRSLSAPLIIVRRPAVS